MFMMLVMAWVELQTFWGRASVASAWVAHWFASRRQKAQSPFLGCIESVALDSRTDESRSTSLSVVVEEFDCYCYRLAFLLEVVWERCGLSNQALPLGL